MSLGDKRESKFDTAESETLCMRGRSMRENRETPEPSSENSAEDRSGKAKSRTPDVNGTGESHSDVVPAKPANEGAKAAEELVEERSLTEGNALKRADHRTPSRTGSRLDLKGIGMAVRCLYLITQGRNRMR